MNWLTPSRRTLKVPANAASVRTQLLGLLELVPLGGMKIPRHIVWSFDQANNLDLSKPANREWWIKQVLMHGRMEDIRSLDLDEVERTLPELYLPKPIKKLWSDYFAKRRTTNRFSENNP